MRYHGQVLDLAQTLNPEQYEAATTTEGPLLILAGAGSGKTRVLVHRIAHILEQKHAEPWQIFAVTFTNKAAGEMRHRLADLIGPGIKEAWIGTFHALCARILRLEGHRLGFDPGFTIYDADDAKRLLKSIMEESGIDPSSHGTPVNAVSHEIDKAKNAGLTPTRFLETSMKFETPAFRAARRVYPKYQKALAKANAMDFGDLLLWALELLKHHPPARNRFARRFRYVLVDEFQDTNRVQYELLQALVNEHRNLAVVGDDDQSIYRWRGADVSNILGFQQQFPDAKVVKLEENYRSTGNILAAANAIIRQNSNRHEKSLRTAADAGPPVAVTMVESGEDEAALIARTIGKLRNDEDRPADAFAILYRQNAQSRAFEEAFRRVRLPFRIVGGTGFYERKEVKDIIAYLRVTANPKSRQDFERIVNVPSRKIGPTSVKRLRAAAEASGDEGAEMLSLPDESLRAAGLGPAAIKKLRALDALLRGFRGLAERVSAAEVAIEIIEATGYVAHLRNADPATADDRVANVQELVSSIAEHEGAAAAEAADAATTEAGADTRPVKEGADAASTEESTDARPAKEGADTRPVKEGADAASTEESTDARPAEEAPDAAPTASGAAGAPTAAAGRPPDAARPSRTPLQAFLDEAALVSPDDGNDGDGVTLMTIHAAKGLEFPVVFMVGLEEMTFPGRRAIDDIDPAAMEEERRLCYVGVTRAMARLYLSAARYRRIYGQEEIRRPSRFLGELPDAVVGDFPELESARRWARARASGPVTVTPTADRGGDRIEYDEPNAGTAPPPSRRGPTETPSWTAGDGTYAPGTAVDHNLFGRGVVQSAEGSGAKARLTIAFPDHGTKKVVARFVKPAGSS